MNLTETILLLFIGGILPPIFWLFYWLREDSEKPEPRGLIFLTFVLGMIFVPIAGALEKFINYLIAGNSNVVPAEIFFGSYVIAITILILWSVIEEALKFLAAYFGGLKRKANDEAIDPIIYMITAALGFAACENALYMFKEISDVGYFTSSIVLTGNFRFIGSTLLHTASSALVGVFLAFAYYKNWQVHRFCLFYGFAGAIALHTIFNSFIIRQGNFTLVGFSVVWVAIIVIILLFEKVKKIKS
ncbi:MAG TPA: PrsW family glutamic-type intramembrane protease [Candidatus Paceibacterota bacterium]|nr:PrsW family glutamic-type intramembrane protease [Candidatus Paceibacterota bacterium]HRZ34617.1 PrsW family glutamic-type intramembrane protease [Candidatus Paceibacterota bacterium]